MNDLFNIFLIVIEMFTIFVLIYNTSKMVK